MNHFELGLIAIGSLLALFVTMKVLTRLVEWGVPRIEDPSLIRRDGFQALVSLTIAFRRAKRATAAMHKRIDEAARDAEARR